jgi:hypothetical protein
MTFLRANGCERPSRFAARFRYVTIGYQFDRSPTAPGGEVGY